MCTSTIRCENSGTRKSRYPDVSNIMLIPCVMLVDKKIVCSHGIGQQCSKSRMCVCDLVLILHPWHEPIWHLVHLYFPVLLWFSYYYKVGVLKEAGHIQ
uniref:Uncharacterized protein n=2 Tax=Triticum urartu TaxID=4572 RepID=A0A8R7TN71_TRIUA